MFRPLLTTVIALGLPAVALAGPIPSTALAATKPNLTAFVQISPTMGPISPVSPAFGPGRPGRPFPPFPGFPGFPWYPGYFPYYGYGYQQPPVVIVPVQYPAPVGPPLPPERVVELSNEFPATLVMEFPAPAEVWVNGEKADAELTREWTLTSPVLKAGAEYTFKIKARWATGGKTYEAERSVVVPGGKRSRAIVVSGNEIKE
jgi:uncharacterized protein (TIGR03000 family)